MKFDSVSYFEIDIVRGDTAVLTVEFFDSNNNPLDLSGWVVRFAARLKTDPNIYFETEVSLTDPLNGRGVLRLEPTHTAIAGIYDAEFEARSGNDIRTLAQGKLLIRHDVRR